MQVILGLGTNQGDRFANLQTAIKKLTPHLAALKCSGIYTSPALLLPDSPKAWDIEFLNMAVIGNTEAKPEALLNICQHIETEMGRETKHSKWSPRVIDIDILLYGDLALTEKTLTIPHAELPNRAFALLPLLELKPDYPHTKNFAENHGTKRIGQFV